jgi:hypothetical protein
MDILINLDPQSATISHGNQVVVTFQANFDCEKFIVDWYTGPPGSLGLSGEVDAAAGQTITSGSLTARTLPGKVYTFKVTGFFQEDRANHLGTYSTSAQITSAAIITSLKQFLENSGINPEGVSLKSLVPSGETQKIHEP